MLEKKYGSCLCGKVKFEIDGEFENFYLCHCKRCRKDTGSAHAANLFSTTASITWISGKDLVKAYTVPNSQHKKAFCSECGSALPNLQMDGELLVVPAGCLDSYLPIVPDAHIFVTSRAEWDNDLEKLSKFDQLPE